MDSDTFSDILGIGLMVFFIGGVAVSGLALLIVGIAQGEWLAVLGGLVVLLIAAVPCLVAYRDWSDNHW